MQHSTTSSDFKPTFIVETNDAGQRIPVGKNILSNYRIIPGKQYNPTPMQIAVAALVEINKAYLIRYIVEYTTTNFGPSLPEAHFDYDSKLSLNEVALIERAIKIQYQAFKMKMACSACIDEISTAKYFLEIRNRA